MSDCLVVEIREQLPEFLHNRLEAAARARVEAHLLTCADCAAELALLRSVREALTQAPVVDVSAVVRALPKPPKRRPRATARFTMLQLAAALTFVSLGGVSIAVARAFFGGEQAVLVADSTLHRDSAALGAAGLGISFGGGVGDLADEDLESLLSAVESIEALPPAEPAELPVGGIGGTAP